MAWKAPVMCTWGLRCDADSFTYIYLNNGCIGNIFWGCKKRNIVSCNGLQSKVQNGYFNGYTVGIPGLCKDYKEKSMMGLVTHAKFCIVWEGFGSGNKEPLWNLMWNEFLYILNHCAYIYDLLCSSGLYTTGSLLFEVIWEKYYILWTFQQLVLL